MSNPIHSGFHIGPAGPNAIEFRLAHAELRAGRGLVTVREARLLITAIEQAIDRAERLSVPEQPAAEDIDLDDLLS